MWVTAQLLYHGMLWHGMRHAWVWWRDQTRLSRCFSCGEAVRMRIGQLEVDMLD